MPELQINVHVSQNLLDDARDNEAVRDLIAEEARRQALDLLKTEVPTHESPSD